MSEEKQVDVELTEEVRARLRGYLGFDSSSTFKFVPEFCRDKNKDGEYIIPKKFWPVFELQAKNGVELATMDDKASIFVFDAEEGERVEKTRRGRYMIETLQRGVKGWKNFRMEDFTTMIPFDKEKMIDAETGYLRESAFHKWKPNLLVSLCNAIDRNSRLTNEELVGLDY